MGNEVLYRVRFMASDGKLYGVDWRELLVSLERQARSQTTTSLIHCGKQSVHSLGAELLPLLQMTTQFSRVYPRFRARKEKRPLAFE